jgi:predicted Fe-Mo cluster-binding NifX family protein
MRIAVALDPASGEVFQHFGHTGFFKLYDVADGKVVRSLTIAAPEAGHDALAAFLAELRANALICGGIGGGARAALETAGVILYGGVAGEADTAVNAFLAGTLGYDPDVHCHHHDAGEAHACGGCQHHAPGAEHDCGGCAHFGS